MSSGRSIVGRWQGVNEAEIVTPSGKNVAITNEEIY
jgi:hypothetical protein